MRYLYIYKQYVFTKFATCNLDLNLKYFQDQIQIRYKSDTTISDTFNLTYLQNFHIL